MALGPEKLSPHADPRGARRGPALSGPGVVAAASNWWSGYQQVSERIDGLQVRICADIRNIYVLRPRLVLVRIPDNGWRLECDTRSKPKGTERGALQPPTWKRRARQLTNTSSSIQAGVLRKH